jgi:hypothetical protein
MVASFGSLPNVAERRIEHTTALVGFFVLVSDFSFEIVITPKVAPHTSSSVSVPRQRNYT